MLLVVTTNAATGFSYIVITILMINFVRTSNVINLFLGSQPQSASKKKKYLFRLMTWMVMFFAFFIALCALTHVLNVARAFYPESEFLAWVQIVILTLCSIFSLVTALVSYKLFPIISGMLPKFELNNEGNFEHAETYMLEIVEMVKESIIVLSTDLRIVRKNEASKEIFGSPNLIGASVLDFVHPEDVRNFEIFAASALASYSASPITFEYRIKPAATTTTTTTTTAAAVAVQGQSGKSNTQTLSANSSHSSKALCEKTADNTPRGSFQSPHTSSSSSSSLRPLLLLDDAATQPSEEYVWVESTILKHMYLTDDDSEDGEGGGGLRYSLEMVSRNIDERKRRQQSQLDSMLKQTEEQSRINAAKLRYLSCIAHDLKTPLQSFCYTLDLLQQSTLGSEQRELVQQASVAVDLMKLTISQTMDISKALSGAKLMPRRTTLSLRSIVERVDMLISGFGKQVPVTFELSPVIADQIITDEEWLWQMLLNLLTNACKYTDRGSITAKVSLSNESSSGSGRSSCESRPALSTTERGVSVACQSSSPTSAALAEAHSSAATSSTAAPMLLFEVVDTGVGVDSSKLASMFDAFAQVQEGQATGTGLGLFGVRMRAEGLQGYCGARHNTESSTGTGTIMWFAIPYVPDRCRSSSSDMRFSRSGDSAENVLAAANTGVVGSSSSGSGGRGSVALPSPNELTRRAQEILRSRPVTAMVVEDTLTVRKLMERMLLQMGFASVVGYENGSKGLDAMMAGTVDIVFSDVQMPIMTGPEMVSRFRKFEAAALASGERRSRQVVVAVTANGTETRDNADASFDGVYAKPIGRNDIYQIISKFLEAD